MSDAPDLIRLFTSLPLPVGNSPVGRFSAQPIAGIPSCSVGKDATGCPVLLVETDASAPRAAAAPIILQNLSVLHNVDCRMQDSDGGSSIHRLSVIRCRGDDPLLHEYFLRALTPVLASLPARPAREQVVGAIATLIELFRRATQPPRKTVQGLWAELFVIRAAPDPAFLLRCWHIAPEDRFDFAEDTQRLEVKTASGRVRTHRFSHEQLRPVAGTVVVIASVLMERSAGGQSVNDIVDEIRQLVADPDLLLRLDAVIADTLGSDWRAAQEDRFDRQLAAESLRFLDARTIPSVPAELPPEVTDVHFCVDLSNHPLTLPDELRQQRGLFAAALPR
ncbi:MAG: PD-(D/E)XK motif protein [Isosphaeraceae bacterium]